MMPSAAWLLAALPGLGDDERPEATCRRDEPPCTAADFVQNYLRSHDATGVTFGGGMRTPQHSGLAQIYTGKAAADFFGVPVSE